MTIKVKKANEVGTVEPTGELPAKGTTDTGSGKPADAAYPDKVLDATSRKYVDLDTGDASKRSIPAPVAKSSEYDETVAGNPVQPVAGSPDPDDNEEGVKTKFGRAEPSIGAVNADSASEKRRTVEYIEKKKRLEALAKLQEAQLRVQALELQAREAEAKAKIQRAAELAKPQALISSTKAISANAQKTSALEVEIARPSAWMRSVARHENVPATFLWNINKEKIFENYGARRTKNVDSQGNIVESDLPKGARSYASEAGSQPSVGGPDSTSFMRIMSEQVVVMPNNKVVTPIRQFCETKIIPPGTKEAFFYDFGDVSFSDITEGGDGTADPATATSVSTPVIRTAATTTTPRGTRVVIGYSQVEESPIDIVAAVNRAFALESVHDESKRVFTTYNIDSGSSGDATNRKAVGGGTKSGFWINGNDGTDIGADASGLGKLTFKGLLAAKKKIRKQGFDTSNLVMYTSLDAIDDVILDPDLDTYLGFSKPNVITEGIIERAAGINLVASSAITSSTQSGGFRSVCFIPGISFGLVVGRDLTMEAQRRNEWQTIHLTGTQKINAVVRTKEATVRVSHL
jgi:hypothetical protein